MSIIKYYTDGGCRPNPGRGGYAVIKNGSPYLIGGADYTTNNRMEIIAVIQALTDANGKPCVINTDSSYVYGVVSSWIFGWAKKGFTKKGEPIPNADLMQKLYDLRKRSQAIFNKVGGHVGVAGNELADHWATEAINRRIVVPVMVKDLNDIQLGEPAIEFKSKYNDASYLL